MHENDDVHAIDFKEMTGHLPAILGSKGLRRLHDPVSQLPHGPGHEHDHIPNPGAIEWIPTVETAHHHEVKFFTQKDKQSLYDGANWKFHQEWVEWSQKNARDLSRLTAPRLPHDLTKIDRRAISRCFNLLKQAFEPVALPKEVVTRNNLVLPPSGSTQISAPFAGDDVARPKSSGDVIEAMTKGAEEAMEEVTRPKTSNGVLTVDEEDRPKRGTRRARTRRDGSVGRPITPQKKVEFDKVNSFSIQQIYQYLHERGEVSRSVSRRTSQILVSRSGVSQISLM